jgi:GNAT superfamily N-acetyltransferase
VTRSGRWRKYLDDLRTFPAAATVGWRRDRWHGLWDALAPRTVFRVFRSGRLVVYSQRVGAARELPPPKGVRIAPLSDADWPALADMLDARSLDRFHTLVNHGHYCVLAWRGTMPVGYAWVALRMDREVSHCDLPLPGHAAYLWDLYVVPAERSHGIGSALASARLRVARELGCREGWRMITSSNHASLRTLRRSGDDTRVVGEIRFLKLLSHVRSEFRRATAEAR